MQCLLQFQNKYELPQRQSSAETLTRSWADISLPPCSIRDFQQVNQVGSDHNPCGLQKRRCSYMPPMTTANPTEERIRARSLVHAHNQSASLLHPLFVHSREMSLESGYLSHEGGSSRSTPSSPKRITHFLQSKRRQSGRQLSQSASEDDGSPEPTQYLSVREKRQTFQK